MSEPPAYVVFQEGAISLLQNSDQNMSSQTERVVDRTKFISPDKLTPPFNDNKDKLNAYIQGFKRVATGHNWPPEQWVLAKSMCLSGEALTVVGRMTATDSFIYNRV